MATIALILVVALLLSMDKLGPLAWQAGKSLYARIPAASFVNPLTVSVELPLWKVAVLIGAFWVVCGGGISLPHVGGWSWPSISVFGPANGPRELLVVHETGDENPAKSALFIELRAGEAAKYLKEKQHTLLILDKDAKDESGNPAEPLARFAPFTPPELLIIAPPNKLLSRQKMPATSAEFLAAVKAKGG